MTSTFRRFPTLAVLLALVACRSPAAGGGGGGGARVDARPLTAADVELYARVMRSAADGLEGGAAPDPRADEHIVRAQRLDPVRYALVRDRIESVLRQEEVGTEDDRPLPATRPPDDGTAPPAVLTAEQLDFRMRSRALARADYRVLAPRWVELRRLLLRVRGPAAPTSRPR